MKGVIATLLALPFVAWLTIRIVLGIQFNIDCGGHLKRAADANTVELAKAELKTALNYIEAHGLTSGFTSVLYNTPDEDVAFWYNNLRQSYAELNQVTDESTQLEKSNLLIKLRETLLDHGRDSDTITKPSGISVFPHNVAYGAFFGVSFLLMILGAWVTFYDEF